MGNRDADEQPATQLRTKDVEFSVTIALIHGCHHATARGSDF